MYMRQCLFGEDQQILDDGPVFINGSGFDQDGGEIACHGDISSHSSLQRHR